MLISARFKKFTSGWLRCCGGLGPGTSQAATSRQGRTSTYFSNKTNRNRNNKLNVLGIRQSRVTPNSKL